MNGKGSVHIKRFIEDGALKDDFISELIGVYPKEECIRFETEFAKTTLFPKGLNGNAGHCIIQTDEMRKKNSEAKTGSRHPLFGKHHSDETKKKMSAAKLGKTHSEEHKKKNSEAQKGKTISKETREKISHALKGRPRPEEVKEKIRVGRRKINTLNED